MSTTKHTEGLVYYGVAYDRERGPVPFEYESPGYYDNTGIISADGTTVVGCGEYDVFESPADARRLIACWNAFDGLTTEQVEAIGAGGVREMIESLRELASSDEGESGDTCRAILARLEGNG